MEYMPMVAQALAGNDFTVFAYFTDGAVRLVDAKPLIARGGVFSCLADEAFFKDCLTVMNDTVAWDVAGDRDATRCLDLDPCGIYEAAQVVADPLAQAA